MYKIEIRTLPISEPNTKSMQANIQISMAVSPSAFGELVVMLLKMLIKTRNNVMSNAIRPEIKSGYFTILIAISVYPSPSSLTILDENRKKSHFDNFTLFENYFNFPPIFVLLQVTFSVIFKLCELGERWERC